MPGGQAMCEIELRLVQPLLGGLAIPVHGCRRVGNQAGQSVVIGCAEVELRPGIPLAGLRLQLLDRRSG